MAKGLGYFLRRNTGVVAYSKTSETSTMKVLTQSERALQITFLLKVITFLLLFILTLVYRNHYIIQEQAS